MKIHKYYEIGWFLFEVYADKHFFQFIGHIKQYELFFIHKSNLKNKEI